MTEPRQLAVVHQYDDLIEALRRRCDELGIPFEVADEVAGLPDPPIYHPKPMFRNAERRSNLAPVVDRQQA